MRHRGWRRHHRQRLIDSRLNIIRNVWRDEPQYYSINGQYLTPEEATVEFATRWATSRRTLCSCPMCKWNRWVPPWGREPTRQEIRSEIDMREQLDDWTDSQ